MGSKKFVPTPPPPEINDACVGIPVGIPVRYTPESAHVHREMPGELVRDSWCRPGFAWMNVSANCVLSNNIGVSRCIAGILVGRRVDMSTCRSVKMCSQGELFYIAIDLTESSQLGVVRLGGVDRSVGWGVRKVSWHGVKKFVPTILPPAPPRFMDRIPPPLTEPQNRTADGME